MTLKCIYPRDTSKIGNMVNCSKLATYSTYDAYSEYMPGRMSVREVKLLQANREGSESLLFTLLIQRKLVVPLDR